MVEPGAEHDGRRRRVRSLRTAGTLLVVLGALLVAAVSGREVAAGFSDDVERDALADGLALLQRVPHGADAPVLDCGSVAAVHEGPDGYRIDDGDNTPLDCFAAAVDARKDVTLQWSLVLPPHPQRSATDAVVKHRFSVVDGQASVVFGQGLAEPGAVITLRHCERVHLRADGFPACGGATQDHTFSDHPAR